MGAGAGGGVGGTGGSSKGRQSLVPGHSAKTPKKAWISRSIKMVRPTKKGK